MENITERISFKNEILRKLVHLASSFVPVFYLLTDKYFTLILLTFCVAFMLFLDIGRYKSAAVNKYYIKFLKPVLRQKEEKTNKFLFTGGTFVFISDLLCVLIFPKEIAIAAMFVMIFCDSFAAIVGKSIGKLKINNKTLEGTLAFIVSGFILSLILPKYTNSNFEYYIFIFVIVLTALIELIEFKIDDNLIIPLLFGSLYWFSVWLFIL